MLCSVTFVGKDKFFKIFIGTHTSSGAISTEHSITERPVLSTRFYIMFCLIIPSFAFILVLYEFLLIFVLLSGTSPNISDIIVYA